MLDLLKSKELSPQHVSGLKELLEHDGLIRPVPAMELHKFTNEQIRYWAHFAGVYQIPTIELIDFLREEMEGLTIEVGAGNGCIGRALNIRMFDSHAQEKPDIAMMYNSALQPRVNYGSDVIDLSANTAVKRYNPTTVIGCWVTQYGTSGQSFMYGIDEDEMFADGIKKYIMVGNDDSHAKKRVLKSHNVKRIYRPWIVSRAKHPKKNVIYIIT